MRLGFTLIELVVGLVISTVLVVALGSAVVITSKAIPDSQSPEKTVLDTTRLLPDITQELRYALRVFDRTSTAVKFTVADRDGDTKQETIRYEWSGTVGDPLTRQYNGGTISNVAENLHEFELLYETEMVTETIEFEVESTEVVLASYEDPDDVDEYAITSSDWLGQYFEPSLPPDATRWRVTRVLIKAHLDGAANGETLIQIRKASVLKRPLPRVLEQKSMWEAFLSFGYTWKEFSFIDLPWLSPNIGLCLVLEWANGAISAVIRCDNDGGSGLVLSNDAGISWSNTTQSMVYFVYGTYMTPTTETIDHHFLHQVQIGLQIGSDPSSRVDTAVGILNRPEVKL